MGDLFMKKLFHPGRFCGKGDKTHNEQESRYGVVHGSRQIQCGIAVTLKLNQPRELVKAKAVTRFFA
jgi:hypothetical protein